MKEIIVLSLFIMITFKSYGNISYSPAGKTWFYEGSDINPVKMIFKKDHSVEFKQMNNKPSLEYLGKVTWKYDEKNAILTLSLPQAKKSIFSILKGSLNVQGVGYANPLAVDEKLKTVDYKFPKRINFLGLIYEEISKK